MGFNRHSLTNLKNQTIFFPNPKGFNDPFDCAIQCDLEDLSNESLTQIYNHYLNECPDKSEFIRQVGDQHDDRFKKIFRKAVRGAFTEIRDLMLNERGVACFSSVHDEILMWSHYSQSHTGFCLEFDTGFEPFSKAFKVDYEKNIPSINPCSLIISGASEQVMKMFKTKYDKWAYESEWRIFHLKANQPYVYPPESLTGIYFGAEIDFAHLEIIALIIQGQNPNVKLYQSKKQENSYKIEFEEVSYTPHIKAKEAKKS